MRAARRCASFRAAMTIEIVGSAAAVSGRSDRGRSRAHARSASGYPAYTYITTATDNQKTSAITFMPPRARVHVPRTPGSVRRA